MPKRTPSSSCSQLNITERSILQSEYNAIHYITHSSLLLQEHIFSCSLFLLITFTTIQCNVWPLIPHPLHVDGLLVFLAARVLGRGAGASLGSPRDLGSSLGVAHGWEGEGGAWHARWPVGKSRVRKSGILVKKSCPLQILTEFANRCHGKATEGIQDKNMTKEGSLNFLRA